MKKIEQTKCEVKLKTELRSYKVTADITERNNKN